METALQAFTIYFDGRIPTHETRHDHLHRRPDAPCAAAVKSELNLRSQLGGECEALIRLALDEQRHGLDQGEVGEGLREVP